MGRRKISIAPIADDRNRSVTFLKRKNGLFKKAYELGILCSAEVAVVVFSSAGKLFEFSSADMDPILLRYSHYSGPAHEKRGPSDYATKDIPDLAKRGLGGKMTTLSDEDGALDPEDGDGSGGDESMDEIPAPAVPAKKGARKAAGSSAKKRPGSNGTKSERSSSVASQRQPNEEPLHQGFNFQESLEQRAPMHQLPPLSQMPPPFANPYQPQPQAVFNPYLAQLPPGFPSGMGMPPSWAYTGTPAPAPSTSAGPSGPIAGWNNFMSPMQQHHFTQQMQQQQAHQAQQNAANPFYAPTNHFGGPPDFGTQQLQAALQQSQHPNPHRFFSSGGPVPSAVAPYSPSQPSVLPPLQPPRRRGTDSSVDSGVGGERSASRASGVSRSNSGTQKPRLSVNIPSEEERRAKSGGSVLVPPNGEGGGGGSNHVFTEEPEGLDDDRDPNTGLPSSSGSRFAADLLPSPAGFLNDVLYSAGPFSLQTAMPITNRTNDSSVFEWPKASDSVFEGAAAIRRLKRGSDDLPSPVTAAARELEDRMAMGEEGRESSAEEGSVKKSRLKRG